MAVRILIWPSVNEVYTQFFQRFKAFVPIIWLPFALLLLWDGFFWFFPDLWWEVAHSNFADFIHGFFYKVGMSVFEIFMVSVIFVALLRWLVLEEKPDTRELSYQKGIPDLRTVFRLPYYFQFGRNEFLYALLVLGLTIFSLALVEIVNISHFYFGYKPSGIYDDRMLFYLYAFLFRAAQFLGHLIFFVFILAFVNVAVTGSYNFFACINKIRGNIFRILIIDLLIFAPYYFFDVTYYVGVNLLTEWPQIQGLINFSAGRILYDLHHFMSFILYYCCLLAYAIFMSLVYKQIMVKHDKN